MTRKLRLLHLEDDPRDAEIVRTRLAKSGLDLEIVHVSSGEEYKRALERGPHDLILTDFVLPGLDGVQALQLARRGNPDVPVIFISGTIGEDVAVDCLLSGASDYILKDNLRRLVPAVERALREAEEQRRRKRAEEEVHDLYNRAPCGYHSLDPEGVIVRINDTELGWLGYSREELVGKRKLHELMTADSAKLFYHLFPVFKERGWVKDLEVEMARKDGTTFPVLVNAVAVRDAEGRYVQSRSTVVDITERRKAEEQLRQAQRMEVIGRLAGGVAHDFNNLLTPILGYCDILLGQLGKGDPYREELEEIRRAGERAAGLTRQLLAFSRKQVLQPRTLNLNDALRDIEKLLRRLIGEDILLSMILGPDVGQTRVDPGQLEQVVMNLAVNARDAMPQGGRLTIETAKVELDANYAGAHAEVVPGPYLLLSVSDTGIGMSKETMSHLFEPFFTTKPRGKGTGLGLATVYGIVKQSGGHLWVYSEPDRGTTFKVYLPEVKEAAESRGLPADRRTAAGGSETLLLLEDDSGLRTFASLALRLAGYTVLEAADGEAALRLSRAHPGFIHLLLTDVVMPGLSGRDVAQKLRGERKGIKILYMSGYTENAIVHHGVLDEGTLLLEKPFTADTLTRKVRDVLDSGGAAGG